VSRDLFILGDADNVGKKIQGLILSGDLEGLRALSSSLTMCIAEIADIARTELRADVVFYGGDELLARVDPDDFSEAKLLGFMRYFKERTLVTISFGVGWSTEEAFINLARAKATGEGSLFLPLNLTQSFKRMAEPSVDTTVLRGSLIE